MGVFLACSSFRRKPDSSFTRRRPKQDPGFRRGDEWWRTASLRQTVTVLA
jgi:hypothetical protein